MPLRELNAEIFVKDEAIVCVSGADIAALKQQALVNPRQRVRICAHYDASDLLHEMLIILTRSAYVRPHKHLNKSESVHIIEGEVDVVFFDEKSTVTDVVRLGEYQSGRQFYYRVADPRYHALLIRSEVLVFHETTNGPFRREDTLFAPWAPEESDLVACGEFTARVAREVAERR